MYLREMGTVPLLTREGEVEIARRIERGKLAVIKSISRTPLVAKKVIELGDQLHTGERTIRELVIFNDEEITDERIDERSQAGAEADRRGPQGARGLREARGEAAPKRRRARRRATSASTAARAGRRCARASSCRNYIRKIEFTEAVKRRLIDEMKDAVESVKAVQREIDAFDRQLNPKNKKQQAARKRTRRTPAPDQGAAGSSSRR